MATASDISVGLAHELILTACKAGFEPKDFTALAQSEEKLRQLLCFVRGHAELTQVKHVIDCDADPLLPYDDWKVEQHKKGGQFIWDPTKLRLHLSENQLNGRSIEGNKLREELADKPTLNANLLDYLIRIRHQHLIPEEWKVDEYGNTHYIYFWGTIYRYSIGGLYVRCLCFASGHWRWGDYWLDNVWDAQYPAVVLANSELGA